MSYADLGARVAAMRSGGDHAGAQALAEAERDRYPGEWHSIDWWRACAAARDGRDGDALAILSAAIDRGDWYAPDNLRDTSDLAGLQGDPQFESIVESCTARRDEALGRAAPALTLAAPGSPPPWPALLVLHGNGEPVTSVVEHWRAPGRLLAAPQSGTPSGPDRFVWAAATTGEVVRHAATLASLGAVATGDLVIGGFGRGGYHALRLALTARVAARGVVAVAPAMNDISEIEDAIPRAAARGLRVAMIAGDGDPKPARAVPRIAAQLRDGGVATDEDVIDGVSRDYPPGFAQRLAAMLAFVAPE